MVHFLRDKKITIIMVLLLIALSVYSIFTFKLNLGSSFYDSTALVIELSNSLSTDNVQGEIEKIVPISAIEKEGMAKFHIYFQNLSESSKEQLNNSLSQIFPSLLSSNYYDYQPVREQLLEERITLVASILGFLALIFTAFKIKNIGLTRLEVSNFILNEIIIILFNFILLGGAMALSGQLGVVMDIAYFTMTVCALFLILAFELYYLLKFAATAREFKKYDLTQIESKITTMYWPEFMFLLSLSLVIFFLPWLVVNMGLALSALQILVAVLLSSYSFFVLRSHFNKIELLNLPLIKKWKFLQRNW